MVYNINISCSKSSNATNNQTLLPVSNDILKQLNYTGYYYERFPDESLNDTSIFNDTTTICEFLNSTDVIRRFAKLLGINLPEPGLHFDPSSADFWRLFIGPFMYSTTSMVSLLFGGITAFKVYRLYKKGKAYTRPRQDIVLLCK